MKNKLIFILISYVLFSSPVFCEKLITLAYVDFPPYEFNNNGKPDGILVRIVQTVFDRAGFELQLKNLPFKRAYTTCKDGKIDGIFNFYKIPEREAFFDYTEPIIKNRLVLFVQKNSSLQFNRLEDLKDMNVGVMRGYTYGSDFDKSPLFFRDATNSHESNFKKLALGRIDAYPCDQQVGMHMIRKYDLTSEIKSLPTPLKIMNGHIGFTKGKHRQVIKKINQIIREMKQNGEIQKLIDDYTAAADKKN